VARDHLLPGLRATPGVRLVAACDRDPAAAARLAAAARSAPTARPAEPAPTVDGEPCVTTDLDVLLATPGLDAVYVATPNAAHRAVVEAVAERGVPVLCEKPLAADVADAEAIVAACAGQLAATAFDQRFHPAHRRIAEIVAAGELGTVTAVRIVYACWLPPDWSPYGPPPQQSAGRTRSGHAPSTAVADPPRHDNWRVDPVRAGGGALVDLAPHGIDLVGALLGGDDLDTLDVLLQHRVHDYPVDDGAVLAGRTAGDVLFSGHVAFNTPDTLPRRRLEVVGTRAQLVAENTMGQTAGGRLTRTGADGTVADVPFDTTTGPFAAQLAAFSAAVAGSAGTAGTAAWPWPLERDLHLHGLLHRAVDRATGRDTPRATARAATERSR
jgi:predicted dehydrogenase